MTDNKALQRIEPMPTSPSVEGMITLAIEKGATVETLERLMAIRREVRAEQAKAEFDRALAAFQGECPTIQKTAKVMNKDGKTVRYQYAPLDAIIHQVKGLLQKHGFSYSVDAKAELKQVTAVCKLSHLSGHSETGEFAVPIDSDAYMNPAQRVASALTFAKRYAFCNKCGIMTGDLDDDSEGSHEPKAPKTDNDNSRQATERPQTSAPQKPTAKTPPLATSKTREWFIAEMRKRFSDITILQYGCDKGPPYALMPDERIEEWDLAHVPTSKEALQDRIEDCAEFMNVEPRELGESTQTAIKPVSSDFNSTPATSDEQSGSETPEGSRDAPEGAGGGPETQDDGVLEITGKLEQVSVKEGRSSRGAWKCFGVRIGKDFWVNSFSATLGKLAEADKGKTVRVLYTQGERGNNLVGIELAK